MENKNQSYMSLKFICIHLDYIIEIDRFNGIEVDHFK